MIIIILLKFVDDCYKFVLNISYQMPYYVIPNTVKNCNLIIYYIFVQKIAY